MTGILRKIPLVSAFVPPKLPEAPQFAQPTVEASVDRTKRLAQVAAEEKRKKLRGAARRTSTQRTGPLGATVAAQNIAKKTLLGQ